MLTDSYNTIFENKERILFIFAHPDDLETFSGGLVSRLIADNKTVGVAKMTLGNKGSRQTLISEKELEAARQKEDKAAAEILGIKPENHFYMGFKDGEITSDTSHREKVVWLIRKFKPDIVVTHNPEHLIIRWSKDTSWINHNDHRHTGILVTDACYPYSRDLLFYPEQFKEEGIDSHIVSEYLYVDYYDHPDTIAIDISDFKNTKLRSLCAHESQYTEEKAESSVEFFTNLDDSGKYYERYRYVIAD